MKGNEDIIQVLNDVLCAELTAINQYFIHARMCQNWRYKRLADYIHKESIGEMKHAQELIERILYLDGVPEHAEVHEDQRRADGAGAAPVRPAARVRRRQAAERGHRALPRRKGDNGTRALLEEILKSEEEHIDWLEAQLQQIKEIGVENYLAQQIDE